MHHHPMMRMKHRQMISDKQWTWLEQLLEEPADVDLTLVSVPFKCLMTIQVKSACIPTERERLYDLIPINQSCCNG
jgi:hypothetical protein